MSRKYTANEMREMALVEESYGWDVVAKMLRQAADIMERESTREKSSQVGNAAAMRDALLRCDAIAQMPEIREYLIVKDMRNLIKKAISAHPRNCDVGNEKEQSDRLDAFCSKHFRYGDANPCSQCPVAAGSDSSLPCVIMDYSNVRAVCFDCARKAGFMQKKKAVIAFEEECDICKARRPCTDLHHDWIPPKKKAR